jgi:lipopolysaccharide/colanic/teichoic acid biosynthesis glycosyltransferase
MASSSEMVPVVDAEPAVVDALEDLLSVISTPQLPSPGGLSFRTRLVTRAQVRSLRAAAAKRTFDVVVASIVLTLAAPPMACVALAVRLTSRGPVLFRQIRVGLRGRLFTCLKFRTMKDGAESRLAAMLLTDDVRLDAFRTSFKLADDPRVTRIGRFLRRTSLDELPQLLNVVRGDMSIVGPRPVVPEELWRYGEYAEVVLQARPGITGPWQANGRSRMPYAERVRLDVDYALNRTFWKDLDLVRRTIRLVLTPPPESAV